MKERVLKLVSVYDSQEDLDRARKVLKENVMNDNSSLLLTDINNPEDAEFTIEYNDKVKDKLSEVLDSPFYINHLLLNEAIIDIDEEGQPYEIAIKFLAGNPEFDDTTPNYDDYLKPKKRKKRISKNAFAKSPSRNKDHDIEKAAQSSDQAEDHSDDNNHTSDSNDRQAIDDVLPNAETLKEQTSSELRKPDDAKSKLFESLTFANEQTVTMLYNQYKDSIEQFNQMDISQKINDFRQHLLDNPNQKQKSLVDYEKASKEEQDFAISLQTTIESIQQGRDNQFKEYLKSKQIDADNLSEEDYDMYVEQFNAEYPDDTDQKVAQYLDSVRGDYDKVGAKVDAAADEASKDLINQFKDYYNDSSINNTLDYIEQKESYQQKYDESLEELRNQEQKNSVDYSDTYIPGLDDEDEEENSHDESQEQDVQENIKQNQNNDNQRQEESFTPEQLNEFEDEQPINNQQSQDSNNDSTNDNSSSNDDTFDENDPFGEDSQQNEDSAEMFDEDDPFGEKQQEEQTSNSDETSNDKNDETENSNLEDHNEQNDDDNINGEEQEQQESDQQQEDNEEQQETASNILGDIDNDKEYAESGNDLISKTKARNQPKDDGKKSRHKIKNNKKKAKNDEEDNKESNQSSVLDETEKKQEDEWVNPFVRLWRALDDKTKKRIKIWVPVGILIAIILIVLVSVLVSNSDAHQEKVKKEEHAKQVKQEKKMKEIAKYTKGKKLPAVDKKTQSRIDFQVTDVRKDGGVVGYYYSTKDGERVKKKKSASPEVVQDYIKRMKKKEKAENSTTY